MIVSLLNWAIYHHSVTWVLVKTVFTIHIHLQWLVFVVPFLWVLDCLQLMTLLLDNTSFENSQQFELRNLPCLQSIILHRRCFYNAKVFSLLGIIGYVKLTIGFPKLQTVICYCEAFYNCCSFVLKDLPSLQSLELKTRVFYKCQSVVFDGNKMGWLTI